MKKGDRVKINIADIKGNPYTYGVILDTNFLGPGFPLVLCDEYPSKKYSVGTKEVLVMRENLEVIKE